MEEWKEEFRKKFTAGGLTLAFNPEIIEAFIEEEKEKSYSEGYDDCLDTYGDGPSQ